MISIKQHNGLWRIVIENEEFEFITKKDFETVLKELIEMKEAWAQIRKVK